MTGARRWSFSAFDTWFFRESRPHGAAGGNELDSLFPPPARTVAGAVRTLIGEHAGVDWARYARGDGACSVFPDIDLIREIGDARGYGRLDLSGPFLENDGVRLYPVPLTVLECDGAYTHLLPGEPLTCDLGTVALPTPRTALAGASPLEGVFTDAEGFAGALAGKAPRRLFRPDDLWVREPRLGIALDAGRRTVETGLLYQTRHIRPHPETAVAVDVGGISECLHPSAGSTIRLGGEGRPAAVQVRQVRRGLPAPRLDGGSRGLTLALLTHADFGGSWLPPGFERRESDGVTVWHGKLGGVELTIDCAVVGKTVRQGGWDMVHRRPAPVRSLVPAGSVYFVRPRNGSASDAAARLHGLKIGCQTPIGRGELAVGPRHEGGPTDA